MIASRVQAMDTTICPPLYLSVVHLEVGEDDGSLGAALDRITANRDALDAVAAVCDSADILSLPAVHKALAAIRPKGMKLMVVTDGSLASAMDDIVGAGYADMALIRIRGKASDAQKESMGLMEDYGYWYAVEAVIVPGVTDVSAIKDIAASCPGCKRFLIRAVDPSRTDAKKDPLTEKDVRPLVQAVSGMVRNPTFLGFI